MGRKKKQVQSNSRTEEVPEEPPQNEETAVADGGNGKKKWLVWGGVALITAVAAYFRLVRLGESALRADTILFLTVLRDPQFTAGRIYSDWLSLGIGGHFPFALAFTRWLMTLLNLPVNEFGVRFPAAMWGIACIPVMYGMGRDLKDRWFGFLLAGLMAVNPFHIQISREAYFYSPLIFGACLFFWSVLTTAKCAGETKMPRHTWFSGVIGFAVMTHSQITSWPIAALGVLVLLVVHGMRWKKGISDIRPLIGWIALLAVVSLPLVFSEWGALLHLRRAMDPAKRAQVQSIFGATAGWTPMRFLQTVSALAWGISWIRSVVFLLLIGAGIAISRRHIRRGEKWFWLFAVILLGGLLLVYLAKLGKSGGGNIQYRYLGALLPVYLTFIGFAAVEWVNLRIPAARMTGKARTGGILISLLAVFGLLLQPAYMSTQMTGKPVPYKRIVNWVEENFEPGTLVLVDRWFEPWNELKVYDAKNIHFTFTYPNEPLETFKQVKWRETAKQFFARFPQAAYLEIAKSYWEVPEVGPWDWPEVFFARKHVFTNEAGLYLRRLHLASRNDFYSANTNRLIVPLFYNTTEDVMERLRGAGVATAALYGSGWGYTKPFFALNGMEGQRYAEIWRQLNQQGMRNVYMDLRVLEGEAQVYLCNMTSEELTVKLQMAGVAIGGTKKVDAGTSVSQTFEPGKQMVWEMGPILLPPGRTVLRLRDDLWGLAQVPLFVSGMKTVVIEQEVGGTQ
jgi:4-amino-4-deoxy-L-arabinose transferase-like glycosyltransferase